MKDNELFDLFFNPEVAKTFHQTSDFDKALADVWNLMIKEVIADEFKRYTENDDGSICVTVPKKWCKINPGSKPDSDKPKRTMTEEQKKAFAERMAKVREQKNKEKGE